jgi:hypothetical protein
MELIWKTIDDFNLSFRRTKDSMLVFGENGCQGLNALCSVVRRAELGTWLPAATTMQCDTRIKGINAVFNWRELRIISIPT